MKVFSCLRKFSIVSDGMHLTTHSGAVRGLPVPIPPGPHLLTHSEARRSLLLHFPVLFGVLGA